MMTLQEIFANVSKYDAAVRNNAGGFYNHAMFGQSCHPMVEEAWCKLEEAIVNSFGSMDNFKKNLKQPQRASLVVVGLGCPKIVKEICLCHQRLIRTTH